jgi:hypothetical protein
MVIDQKTYYDDYTLSKVRDALAREGVDRDSAAKMILHMQNAGILFRERIPEGIEPDKEENPEASLETNRPTDLRRRQWLIEKMLDRGALQEFDSITPVITWADELEQYIRNGRKQEV